MSDIDIFKLIKILIGVLAFLWPVIQKAIEALRERSERAREAPPVAAPAPVPAAPPPEPLLAEPPAPVLAMEVGPSPARRRLAEEIRQVEQEAVALGESIRQEIANERFVEVLTEWLPREGAKVREALLSEPGPVPEELEESANMFRLVLSEVGELIRQRRDAKLLPLLGDADRLAEACYAPVLTFARAEGLPLSSVRPVAQLAPFDIATWTGFAPTSLAPLFLPESFFSSPVHWTAIAHEIGHDFLVSIPGLRERLAQELGLPPEHLGTIPLRVSESGIEQRELVRVFGAWLEEFFCDVFGTLMCGPAYVATMIEVFSHREVREEVLAVPVDPSIGRYGHHPPGHLRVFTGTQVLERAGFHVDAQRLFARWHERNQLNAEVGVPLLFWVRGRYLALPFAAFEPIINELLDRLYHGPLPSLSGFGLSGISGLDYGPHEHAEAERARASLLAGAVPRVRDVRAIISGAVLATLERPEQAEQLLLKARAAIPAVGTHERAPDSYGMAESTQSARRGLLELHPSALAEALLMQEILARRAPLGARGRMGRRTLRKGA